MSLAPIRALVLGAALGLLAGSCAGPGAIVMASGRDDHGLLERPAVALQRSPTDTTVTGSVPDGAFLRVLGQERAWYRVRSIAEPVQEGWVNDHDLRGTAALTGRGVQVRFSDARWVNGRVEVRVEPLQSGDVVWVDAKDLKEIGAVDPR